MKLAKPLIAIAVALVLQTTLARYLIRGRVGVDLVLVTVTYLGLTAGPVVGLLSGTVAGLAQDALASGVVGIGGLSKTIVGFLAGILGTQFIVTQTIPQFFVFFAATAIHEGLFLGLSVVLGLRQPGFGYTPILYEGIGNALIGVVLFQMTALLPGAVDRRRMARNRVHSRLGS